MDRNELWRLIQQKEREYGWAKAKRFVLTVMFYAALICALGFWREFEGITLFSLDGLLTLAETYLPSVFIAVPFVLLSTLIFNQLQNRGKSEIKHIEELKKQLNEMDNNK